jgi:hypothetical protein
MPYRDRLPVLELVPATPCTARWETMAGDDRVRYCKACRKDVYNLGALTRAEAEAVIVRTGGQLCARYFVRHDGTILLRDCDDGLRLRMSPEMIAFWVMLILAGTVTLTIIAWSTGFRGHALGGASITIAAPRSVG